MRGFSKRESPFINMEEMKMEIKVIFATARCAAVEICDGSIYESDT